MPAAEIEIEPESENCDWRRVTGDRCLWLKLKLNLNIKAVTENCD
jgi:hypothetical protein